ncbi:PREDICTED: N-acetyltransferase ESCO1 [Nanorana parkeri]|uniref:N-acetyltransferase ESCO1 n=1 Tax=Nanorana parkeri TaxID=125878 RepID=UPI0008547CC6|nr:PREDICTED: N-acetyltransferase ESCO1 [Nanorana parkeri]
MTSQKRRSSLPGNTAERQKLNECESHCVTSKKRHVVSKAKTNPNTAQKKQATKAPANKAINSKSSKAETGRKSTVLKTTKKSAAKIVPAKGKSLRLAKEVTSLKKGTQKSSSCASKALKNSPSNVGKTEPSVQNKSNKITRSSSKSSALKLTKTVKCVKKNGSAKTRRKSDLKTVGVKKTVKNTSHGTQSKSTQKKATKCDMQPKCNKQIKKVINVKKQAVPTLKKQAPVRNATAKKSEEESKTKAHKPARAVQKTTGTRNMGIKPSQPNPQLSIIPVVSKKKIEDKTKRGGTKTTPKNSKVRPREKIKTAEAKSVKRSCPVNQSKNSVKSKSVSKSSVEKEITVGNMSVSCCSSNQMLDSSLIGKISSGDKVVVNILSSAAPLKRKRNNIKSMDSTTKSKAKKQKVVQSEANKKKDTPSEDDQKSKRVSILDLCNEIAGEIESDTVEVVKGPSSPTSPTKVKLDDEKVQNLADVSPPAAEKSPVNQLKRFFPSRKPLQTKCKLEKKISPGTMNSKWNKIKFKNNFAQNNILRKRTVLPSLEAIKAKISQGRQPASGIPVSPNSKTSDTTSSTQNRQTKPALFQKKKGNTTLIPGGGDMLEKTSAENGLLENHIKHELEAALDEGFRLHLDSSPENTPLKKSVVSSSPELKPPLIQSSDCKQLTEQMAASAERGVFVKRDVPETRSTKPASDASIQKELRKMKEASSDSTKQPIIDAGQKRFGAISCCVCGMLYTASNPEDETQHLLFHNQFISAVKYVGWKKERIVAEYPDGKIIMVLPDDPKYALKKVEEIREMVDNDLGFQQVPLRLHSRTKTLMFISTDKKVVGCLIAEHIQWGYRVIDDFNPGNLSSDTEKLFSERVKAWCCSTTPEPAICGVSRVWVFSMMRRKKIASRMLECLRNYFIYGSHLSKAEIAFSDPTPDGKLFATNYCGTSQFLIYNFVSGQHPSS